MMRYQRLSPDVLPLANGRKPNNHQRTTTTTCKEDDFRVRSRSGSANPLQNHQETTSISPISHFPPTISDPLPPEVHQNRSPCDNSNGNGRDVLLQWGHKKRSRGSRAESRTAGDESASSSHAGSSRQAVKVQRRAAIAGAEKIAAAAAAMPPPPCGGGSGAYTRGANLRPSMPLRDFSAINRNVEERSGGQSRPGKNRSPDKTHSSGIKPAAAAAVVVHNGFGPSATNNHHRSDPKTSAAGSDRDASTGSGSKTRPEWPRIYVSLSRKEKEEDFLAMKGTKLPQRPKKRAKNIDKSLQYCFPGTWLSDLTRGRYEVREKKCVKKNPRGLKGMESMDSESE